MNAALALEIGRWLLFLLIVAGVIVGNLYSAPVPYVSRVPPHYGEQAR